MARKTPTAPTQASSGPPTHVARTQVPDIRRRIEVDSIRIVDSDGIARIELACYPNSGPRITFLNRNGETTWISPPVDELWRLYKPERKRSAAEAVKNGEMTRKEAAEWVATRGRPDGSQGARS